MIFLKTSPKTKIRLFADDSLLYRTISSKQDTIELQKDLDILQKWESDNSMEFHPDKCQVLRITNKRKPITSYYPIHSIQLQITDSAKYLGVTIDSNLKWTKHYDNICSKANSTLAFLGRNLYCCPRPVKEACYKALVQPVLEYGCCVWDPHHQNHILKFEKIHKRAARFVTNNFSLIQGNTVKNMRELSWIPLEERRARIKLCTLFRAKLGLIDIPIQDLIQVKSNTRRQTSHYFTPQSTVDSHLYSLYPNTLRLWNSLPEDIKSISTVADLKHELKLTTIRCTY